MQIHEVFGALGSLVKGTAQQVAQNTFQALSGQDFHTVFSKTPGLAQMYSKSAASGELADGVKITQPDVIEYTDQNGKTAEFRYNASKKVWTDVNGAPASGEWQAFLNQQNNVLKIKAALATKKAANKTANTAAANGLPANVKVLSTKPIVLQVGKQHFELDDQDRWHFLGAPGPVSPGQQAVLDNYLKLL